MTEDEMCQMDTLNPKDTYCIFRKPIRERGELVTRLQKRKGKERKMRGSCLTAESDLESKIGSF